MFAVCSAAKVNVAVAERLWSVLVAVVGSETWKQRVSLAEAFRLRSPESEPLTGLPIAPAVRVPEYTEVPSAPNAAFEHVVTPLFTARIRPSESVVLPLIDVVIAYRSCSVPAFEIEIGAVTLSPGAIAESDSSAEVGLEEMSTEPVEKTFDPTAWLSVKIACVSAQGAPATKPTASRAIHTFRIEALPSSGKPNGPPWPAFEGSEASDPR